MLTREGGSPVPAVEAMEHPDGAARVGPRIGGVETWIQVLRDGEGLEAHRPAWERLAGRSLEGNAFYEPALLLPALRHLRPPGGVDVVLVFARPAPGPARLAALLPAVRQSHYRGIPLEVRRPWKHVHCFLCTPLVDRDLAEAGLAGLLGWADADGADLLELEGVGGGGPFEAVLGRAAGARPLRRTESHRRALFRPREDAETFLRSAMPKRQPRREIRRRRRRLAEQGELRFELFEDGYDLDAWLEEFLALEASGWKGRAGTALGRRPAERAFFLEAARAAAAKGSLVLHAMRLDGRAIAMKCNFLTARPELPQVPARESAPGGAPGGGSGPAGRGGFAFKIAHDEAWAYYSPGVLLEAEHVTWLHGRPDLAWVDSCAVAGHPMKERLWPDRREVATFLLAGARWRGRWLVRAHPLLRRGAAWLRALRDAGAPRGEAS